MWDLLSTNSCGNSKVPGTTGGPTRFNGWVEELNGEVASLDLAIVTGRGPEMLTNLEGLRPLVRDEDVAPVGYRVLGDNDHYLEEHVRDTAITVIDYSDVQYLGIADTLRQSLIAVNSSDLAGFWVHFDVDALGDDIMPAVDYRYPGGLSWDEVEQILGGLLATKGALGLEVTIFNPRLDPDGNLTRRLRDLIACVLPSRGE
jgi:arginase